MENRSILTAEETAAQENYIGEIRSQNDRDAQENGRRKRAFVLTFGCQQNEADSEKLRGLAKRMGYDLTDRADDADLIAIPAPSASTPKSVRCPSSGSINISKRRTRTSSSRSAGA